LQGKPVVMVIVCWAGDVEEGEKFIRAHVTVMMRA
jgi:hypothetical protein